MTRVSSLEERARASGRHLEAYQFVLDGLQHAASQIYQDDVEKKHIKATQLLDGLSDYAVEKFGQLAPLVFQEWGVCGSQDIGNMVWEMIELGYLRSSDDDAPEDFLVGDDFVERLHVGVRTVFERGHRLEE